MNIIRLLFATTVLTIYSGCSYAPGLSAGTALEESTRLGVDVIGQSSHDMAYITQEGFTVVAHNLTADNIPSLNYQQMNYHSLNKLLSSSHQQYLLSKGDVVSLTLWAYPEITPIRNTGVSTQVGYSIDQKGYLNLPLIGRVNAAGLSANRLEKKLRAAYSKYLKNPDLTLRVIEYNARKYYVYGEVKKSGQYKITDLPVNLMTALGKSGGTSVKANLHDIKLTRKGRTYNLSLPDLRKMGVNATRIQIKSNDILSVGSNELRKVYLLGETAAPRPITIPEEGMSLSYAIGEGKGLQSRTASASKIYVLRDDRKNKVSNIYRVDLSKFENFTLANQFKMQKNDIIFVDATGLAKWNRVINLMLPSTTAIRSAQSIGIN